MDYIAFLLIWNYEMGKKNPFNAFADNHYGDIAFLDIYPWGSMVV